MINVYIVEYDASMVGFRGYKVVQANDPLEARNKFMMWLRSRPEYDSMWQLSYRVIGDDNTPFFVLE